MALESFVTLCYLRFDLGSKRLHMVDCGHTGLLHWHAATQACEILHGNNLALGVREGEIYDQITVPFETGDLLLLFSDGVTEARNREGEVFGEDRLMQCVRTNIALPPGELVEAVRKTTFDFSGSSVPKDDLTCLAMRVVDRGLPVIQSAVELRSTLQDLARARQFVRDVCRRLPGGPLEGDAIGKLELAVTEACSNIVKHAYHGREDQWIRLEAEADAAGVSLRLHHLGDSFDPAKAPPATLDGSRETGFGLYLIAKSVDEVRYFRDDRGRNCVALEKRLDGRAQA
jgi:sigma-B regulation protein RsbU (phosphoserine phosphatase)